MTITITKAKLAVAVLAVALLVPATAYATDVFGDVPDDKFYAGPVKWASDNGITTGTGPTTFEPDRGVTRGESVTFLKRYNDNIVEPGIDAAQADADAAQASADTAQADADAAQASADTAQADADAAQADADTNATDIAANSAALSALPELHWASIDADGTIIAASAGVNQDASQTQKVNTGRYEVDFTVGSIADCHALVSNADTSSVRSNADVILLATQRGGDLSSVFVNTKRISDGADQDSDFTLQLWCGGDVVGAGAPTDGTGVDLGGPDTQALGS